MVEKMKQIETRMAEIRQEILAFDHLCTGTLLSRRIPCGNSTCRCKKDKRRWHGPYYDWTRLKNKKTVHKYLSKSEAVVVKTGIANYKKLLKLTRAWESETLKFIAGPARKEI